MLSNCKNGTLLLMINQSTGLQAHALRRLIVMFVIVISQAQVGYHCYYMRRRAKPEVDEVEC